MKRLMYTIVTVLLFVIGLNTVSASDTLNGRSIIIDGNYAYKHYNKIVNGSNVPVAGGSTVFLTVNGKTAYCIDYGMQFINTSVNASKGELKQFVVSNETYDKLNLIAYYGYDYSGHQTNKYYLASQYLIWKTLYESGAWANYNLTDLAFYTSNAYYHAGNKVDITTEVNTINNLIGAHYVKPSFCDNNFTIEKGDHLTLTDTNNVLTKYNVTSNNGNFSVNTNKLIIDGSKVGNSRISFTKLGLDGESLVYGANGYQNLFVVNNTKTISCNINVNVYEKQVITKYGELKVIKVEKDNTEIKIPGVVFEIYDGNNRLVDTIITDNNGEAKIKLELGTYIVKEVMTGEEYIMNDKPVTVTLTEEDIKTIIFENEKQKIEVPETADLEMYLIWFVGLSFFGYAIYNFKKMKNRA